MSGSGLEEALWRAARSFQAPVDFPVFDECACVPPRTVVLLLLLLLFVCADHSHNRPTFFSGYRTYVPKRTCPPEQPTQSLPLRRRWWK